MRRFEDGEAVIWGLMTVPHSEHEVIPILHQVPNSEQKDIL
jgi:hypothetical protein